MTATTLKLSDLAPGDVAVFVYPDGCEGEPFAVEEYHGVTMVRTENQRTSFDAEGGLHPVRRLGRGRLEPARIVMEGDELGPTSMKLAEAVIDSEKVLKEAYREQVMMLREALTAAKCYGSQGTTDDGISVDYLIENAIAATAPTATEDAPR